MVHFTGYLRSDLNSNLKYLDPSLQQQQTEAPASTSTQLESGSCGTATIQTPLHLTSSTYMLSPALSNKGSCNGSNCTSSSSGESPKSFASTGFPSLPLSSSPNMQPNSQSKF